MAFMVSRKLALIFVLTLALAGCRLGGAAPTATLPPLPTLAPSATLLPADTPAPTQVPAATTASTVSVTEAPTAAVASETAVVAATPDLSATPAASATTAATAAVTQAAGTDKADFVADVTVPDGTTFTPGQTFIKTWQLKNTGGNAWSSAYALVFVRGDQMGGPASVPLSGTVAAGATAEVSVSLTAPTRLGSFTGFWMLRNAAGKLFGISVDANQPVYLKINVGAAAGTPQPTAPAGAITVSAVKLSVVAPDSFSGACPHTYIFTGSLTSSGAGKVTYRLDAASDKPGFVFDLPAPIESTLTGAGPRTFSVDYQLTFTGSVSGQATLHVLTPNALVSDPVTFSLTCQTGTPPP